MGDQVRELTAWLGFDVDLTGADRFAKKFDGLINKSGGLAKKFDKNIGLMSGSLVALGVSAGAVAFKTVSAFTDMESTLREMEFQTGGDGSLKAISNVLQTILDKTGNFVSLSEALESFRFSNIAIKDSEFLLRNMEDMIKLSAVLKDMGLKDVASVLSGFASSGDSLEFFQRMGALFPEQKESIEKTGAGLSGKIGISERKKLIAEMFKIISPNLNKNFLGSLKENKIAFDRVNSGLNDLAVTIGGIASDPIKEGANGLADDLILIRKTIQKTNSFWEGLSYLAGFTQLGSDVNKTTKKIANRLDKSIENTTGFKKQGKVGKQFQSVDLSKGGGSGKADADAIRAFFRNLFTSGSTPSTTTNHTTITIHETKNAKATGQEVVKQLDIKGVNKYNAQARTIQSKEGKR